MTRANTFLSAWLAGALLLCAACAPEASEQAGTSSLGESRADGLLRADEGGDLVVDRHTRRLYDYYLTAEGELGEGAIRSLVADEAHERLGPDAARQALEVFDAYVDYRREAAAVATDDSLTRPEAADRLRAAYDRYLGDIEGFEDELDRIDRAEELAEAAHAGDGVALREVTAAREDEDQVRARATAPKRLRRLVRGLRAEGASEAEIAAMRAGEVGEAAAERLAELDEEREEWRRRVDSFRREREEIRSELSGGDLRDAERELLRARFSGPEERRVRALERRQGRPLPR